MLVWYQFGAIWTVWSTFYAIKWCMFWHFLDNFRALLGPYWIKVCSCFGQLKGFLEIKKMCAVRALFSNNRAEWGWFFHFHTN